VSTEERLNEIVKRSEAQARNRTTLSREGDKHSQTNWCKYLGEEPGPRRAQGGGWFQEGEERGIKERNKTLQLGGNPKEDTHQEGEKRKRSPVF